MLITLTAVAAGCGSGGGGSFSETATVPAGPEDVACQIITSHSATTTLDRPPVFPPAATWSRTFGGSVSYPIIADGNVYVTVKDSTPQGATSLYALNLSTGKTVWGPVELGGSQPWSAVAYDSGCVYSLNANGVFQAFNAVTGAQANSLVLPSGPEAGRPPVAFGGIVYVGGGVDNSLASVTEAEFGVSWSVGINGGGSGSPALREATVEVAKRPYTATASFTAEAAPQRVCSRAVLTALFLMRLVAW